MAKVTARASKHLSAPPERVLELLRDYRDAHQRILTENYSAYRVEQGGTGEGTVFAYHFAAGGRERNYQLRVQERDGRLTERDEGSSFVSTWTVVPAGTGAGVTLEASWDGAGGVAGIFEGLFAPLGLRRIYGQILERLAASVTA